ncbi:MAG: hypothetical protein LBT83_00715 [Tannerella sp.]|nr:hypothetical protein [Tannerella sp.]
MTQIQTQIYTDQKECISETPDPAGRMFIASAMTEEVRPRRGRMYVFDELCYKHVNPSDSLRYREEQPRHCERSEAIAQTTDKLVYWRLLRTSQ